MTLHNGVLIQRHTVTITAVSTGVDDNGDATTPAEATRFARGILFAPEGIAEATDSRSPAVVGDATLYGDTGVCGAQDRITHPSSCCDGFSFARGDWEVVGGSRGWGGGNYQVPISKVG